MKQIFVFLYESPSATIISRILNIKPWAVVVNSSHGFWGEFPSGSSLPANYSNAGLWQPAQIRQLRAAGIKVIGYTSCGYEGVRSGGGQPASCFTLDVVKKQINNMAALDGVDGVFIDEIDNNPNSLQKPYLQALSTLAHSLGLIIWGNTGTDEMSSWFFGDGGFDFMHATEQWAGQSLSNAESNYGPRISVAGFNAGYVASDAIRLTLDAWNKGIALVYINTVEYITLASWWEAYAAGVRGSAETPPVEEPPVEPPIEEPPLPEDPVEPPVEDPTEPPVIIPAEEGSSYAVPLVLGLIGTLLIFATKEG